MNEPSTTSCSQVKNEVMTSPPSPRPPIQTADPLLPLAEGQFTWQQFESFSEDYVRVLAAPTRCTATGRGQGQKGIDFYADEAGGRTTYQCRQWAKFTVKNAEEARSGQRTPRRSSHEALGDYPRKDPQAKPPCQQPSRGVLLGVWRPSRGRRLVQLRMFRIVFDGRSVHRFAHQADVPARPAGGGRSALSGPQRSCAFP